MQRLEVFTAVKMQVKVFWLVMPSSVVIGNQCFGGLYCIHLQGEVNGAGTMGIYIGLSTRVG
jgi:hypothetical protein